MCYECYRMGLKHFNRGTERVPHRRHLWRWFELVTRKGGYSYRLAAFIRMYDQRGELVLTWKLDKAMPIKFKTADLNAKGTEVGVEELHLAHEGLSLV